MIEIPTFKFATTESAKKYSNISFLPKRAYKDDTGWDVKAAQSFTLRAGQYAKIPLGFRVFAPPNFWLELRPRSSSFAKKQLHCLYGVIDEGYQNELVFACQLIPDVSAMAQDLIIEVGDAIGQIIPVRRQEMKVEIITNEEYEKLCKERNSSRATGGFGSTG